MLGLRGVILSSGEVEPVHEVTACTICEETITGPCYVCVQCPARVCGTCEVRGLHSEHYVLRAPPGAQEELSRVASVVRREIEPPPAVKVEPEDDEYDPLSVAQRQEVVSRKRRRRARGTLSVRVYSHNLPNVMRELTDRGFIEKPIEVPLTKRNKLLEE